MVPKTCGQRYYFSADVINSLIRFVSTYKLEALIRFSQARAKACLRDFVLKEDAKDVVELMRESVRQVHMDRSGRIDRARGGNKSHNIETVELLMLTGDTHKMIINTYNNVL